MMKRLLLLPYLLTSLVVYTRCVAYSNAPKATAILFISHHLLSVWWYAITITGLVIALGAKEW